MIYDIPKIKYDKYGTENGNFTTITGNIDKIVLLYKNRSYILALLDLKIQEQ